MKLFRLAAIRLLCSIVMSTCITLASAQGTKVAGKIYQVGDTLPEIKVGIEHYDKAVFSLQELRGKYVILDLWNVYCSSCIAAFPRMDKLREKYADKLEIIKVTRDGREKLEPLFKRSTIARESKLPSITNDTVISNLIDVRYFPSYVLIDTAGVIRYIISSFSDQDLDDFVNGKPINVKNYEEIVNMDFKYPFIVQWYPYLNNNFEGQSYVAKLDKRFRTAGVGGIHQDELGNITDMTFTGTSIQRLYKVAYGFWYRTYWELDFSESRIIFETKAKEQLLYDTAGQRQSYVYELRFKQPVPKAMFHKHLQSQLDLYFHVSSSMEKRMMPCYVLKRTFGSADLVAKNAVVQADEYKEENRFVRKYVSWGPIVRQIGNAFSYQLYDETGIDPKLRVDIEFYLTPEDLPKMNKKLAEYGLIIEKSEREMEVVVIRDI